MGLGVSTFRGAVQRYDRLARDFLDQAVLIREARDADVRIESVKEPTPNGPLGYILQMLIGGVAEKEWEDIRERAQAGIRKRVERGLYLPGSQPPYGYQWADSKKTCMVICPVRGPIVVRIFTLAADGVSASEIARTFNREGIPTPGGRGFWRHQTIFLFFKNPIYWGIPLAFRYKDVEMRVADKQSGELVKRTRRTEVPWEDAVVLPEGVAPAIVSASLAQLARDRITQNRLSPLSSRVEDKSAYLLRGGFAKCAVCGGNLSARSTRKTPGTAPVYYCHLGLMTPELDKRHGLAIAAPALDTWAWEAFLESVDKPDAIAAAMAALNERRHEDTLDELETVRKLLDDNLEHREELYSMLGMLRVPLLSSQDGTASLGR